MGINKYDDDDDDYAHDSDDGADGNDVAAAADSSDDDDYEDDAHDNDDNGEDDEHKDGTVWFPNANDDCLIGQISYKISLGINYIDLSSQGPKMFGFRHKRPQNNWFRIYPIEGSSINIVSVLVIISM
ncbi:secreted acidic protein 2-like [Diceros bicornis minor]|uniref:secreted acidic protein 2-like n=1 Tax=Diceros bicornis minor TaxID=77932 RepID=UPI0026F16237|nr:secreted acidic protein 2-like [Diceros bicornis minor]